MKNISKLLSLSFLLIFLAGCTLYLEDPEGYSGDVVENGDGFTSPITISDSIFTITYQFAEGTVYYQEPSRTYISNVKTDTTAHTVEYTLAGDTPSKWIPQKGGYITTDQIDIFTEGLNHKVDVIEKSGSGYIVKAHLVSLKEVYDRLDVDYSAYLVFDTVPEVDASLSDDYGNHTIALRPVKKKMGARTVVEEDDDEVNGDASKTTAEPTISLGFEYGAGKGESPSLLMNQMIMTSPIMMDAVEELDDRFKDIENFEKWFNSSTEVERELIFLRLSEKLNKLLGKKNAVTTFSKFKYNHWKQFSENIEKVKGKYSKFKNMFGLDKLDKYEKFKTILECSEVTGDFYIGSTVNLYIKIDGHIHIKSLFSENREEGPDYAKVSLQSWIEFYSGLWELGNIGAKIKIPILSTQKSATAIFHPESLSVAKILLGPVLCSINLGGALSLELDASVKNIPASGFYNKYTIKIGGLEFDSRREGLDKFRTIDIPGGDEFLKDVSDGKPKNTGDQTTTLGVSLIPDLQLGLGVYETLIVNFGLELSGRAASTWKSNTAYSDFKMPSEKQPVGNLYDIYNLRYGAGYDTYTFSIRPHADVSLDLQATDMTLGSWAAEKPISWQKLIYDWPQLTTSVKTNWLNTTDTTTAFFATVSLQNKPFSEKPVSDPFLLIYKKDDGYVIKDGEPVEWKAGEYLGKIESTSSRSFDYRYPNERQYEFTLPGGIMAGDFYAVPAYDMGKGNALEHCIGFSKPTIFSREFNEGLTLTDLHIPFLTNDFNDGAALVSPGLGDVMNVPLQFEVNGVNEYGAYENIAVKFIVTKPNKKTQTLGPYILKMSAGVIESKYLYLLTSMPKVASIKDFNYSKEAPSSNTQIEVQLLGLLPGYSHVSKAEKDDYETTLSTMHIGITSGYGCEPIKNDIQRQNEGAWMVGYCPDVNGYGWYYYVDTTTKDSNGNLGETKRITGYTAFDEIEYYCRGNDLEHVE